MVREGGARPGVESVAMSHGPGMDARSTRVAEILNTPSWPTTGRWP